MLGLRSRVHCDDDMICYCSRIPSIFLIWITRCFRVEYIYLIRKVAA
jgi:hypothetical protein